jgi:hypothetical protein
MNLGFPPFPQERGRMGHPLLFCCWCFAKKQKQVLRFAYPMIRRGESWGPKLLSSG